MSKKFIPIVQCPLFTHQNEQAPFSLMFYGIPLAEFMPDCDDLIRGALRRRGLTAYTYKNALIYERRMVQTPGRVR